MDNGTPSYMHPPRGADIAANKAIAAFSYIWILSLVFLLLKKDSPFVQFHARQAFILFLVELVLGFFGGFGIGGILGALSQLLTLVVVVFAIWGFVAAAQGRWTKLPVAYKLSEHVRL